MTRKQALQNVIAMLADSPEYAEEIRILSELSSELPIIHWTDSSIRDAVEQYILDHGEIPTPSKFKKKGMPPHTVIAQKYKVTLKEWLEQNYPKPKPTYEELKAKHTAAFVEDYLRIKPKSQEEFNRNKRPDTRGWQTVAQYHHTKTWRKLLKALDLPLYFDMYRDHKPLNIKVNITVDEDFWATV